MTHTRARTPSRENTLPSEDIAPRSRRRFPTFTLSVIGALMLLVALAPSIISLTPLGPQMVASSAGEQLEGSLTVQSVSIGWFSPVTLRGVTLKDKSDQTVATVETVVVGKSLLGLITNSSDLGTITLDKPQLLLVARADGSNLEDVLAPLLSAPAGGPTPSVILEVREGMVKLVDASTEQAWEFTPVTARVESPRGDQLAWKIAAQTKLGEAGLVADVAHVLGEAGATQVTLETDRFPLEPLQPILSRLLGPVRLSGAVTGKLAAEMVTSGEHQKVIFDNVSAAQVAFAAPQYLGDDVLQFAEARATGSAELNEGVWQLRNFEVQSDVAALSGSGDVRVSDFASGKSIPQTDCDIRGVVDLARLMQLLPGTFHVREGVQITSGQASVSLVSQAVAGGRRFEASLATENIEATNNGQPVALREPVQANAALLQTAQGWQIERLDARSSFLVAGATGTPAQGQLTLQGNLSKLAAELDQFVDLGDIRLAGQLGGEVQWQQESAGTLAASGKLNFSGFEVVAPGVMPWKEDNLAVTFEGQGISLATDAYGIAAGKLAVSSANDQLDVVLEQPVRAITAESPLPLDVRLGGNLATWLPRLQAFVPLAGWRVSGPVQIAAKGNVSPARVDVSNAMFNVQQLQVDGFGLRVYEPKLAGSLKLSFDSATGETTIADAVVQGTSVAAGAKRFVVQTGAAAKMIGDVSMRGNLSNLMAWLDSSGDAATSQYLGEASAEASFTYEAGITKAKLQGQIDDLVYETRVMEPLPAGRPLVRQAAVSSPWETMWQEPLVSFGGEASYDAAKDVISLNQMQTSAGELAVMASGTVSQLAARCQLDLTGEMKYNLASFTPKLQKVLGYTFDMYGASTKAFEVHGPLFDTTSQVAGESPLLPLALTGKASIAWEGMKWMALNVGQAEVAAELKDSTIYVQPTKIPLSQGSLQVAPIIVMRGSDWIVAHDKGRVIDNVVITPEMCNAWIKYVQPLVAEATHAQGKFSVDVERSRIPINDPKAFDAKGTFVMHNVSIGPGPLAQKLLGAAQQVKDFSEGKLGLEALASLASGAFSPPPVDAAPAEPGKSWLTFPEQDVPVEVVEGRVYHEGLTLHHKEFTLRTTGSVGIQDQSVQLVCEIPLQDDWLKDPKLAMLKGKSLKVPITGTVTSPQLDMRAAWSEVRKEVFSNVGGLLQGQFNKGVEQGSGAVQGELQKGQAKVQDEINRGKVKLEDELRKGLKGLFK